MCYEKGTMVPLKKYLSTELVLGTAHTMPHKLPVFSWVLGFDMYFRVIGAT